jgi:NAD(P)-dependent dehydrogenase (short-subunit alcohol dehydrogenase family)
VGSKPRAYWGACAASKAALESLVATYGLEVGNITAIRTHVIDPGATRTTMRARAFPGEDAASVKPPEDVAAQIVAALAR